MTNSDGSTFGCGSFYLTENKNTTFTMQTLLNTCLNELNSRYDEIRNIPSSHQEAITLTSGKSYVVTIDTVISCSNYEQVIAGFTSTPFLSIGVESLESSIFHWNNPLLITLASGLYVITPTRTGLLQSKWFVVVTPRSHTTSQNWRWVWLNCKERG